MYFSPFPLKEQKNILNCFETKKGIHLVELLISAAQMGKRVLSRPYTHQKQLFLWLVL